MRCALALVLLVAAVDVACSSSKDPIVVGAVYPLTGSQASGGVDEYRGVQLAADMVNAAGGVGGRSIAVHRVDVPGSDAVPQAIGSLREDGVRVVLGSYGSTISEPAAALAARHGMLFWETGAVGEMAPMGRGRLVFRVPPTGGRLGAAAIDFVAHTLARKLHRSPTTFRFAVTEVDDAYGRSVAAGAVHELRGLHMELAGVVRYRVEDLNADRVARRLASLHPNVLFAASYVEDGVAIRRAIVRRHLDLLAAIGTSSSYCMPQFGARLGRAAVGLFASDKPDAEYLNADGLAASARSLLHRADAEYEARYDEEMSAPALAGFAAGWALFHDVLPVARDPEDPLSIAAAARGVDLPMGSLPNGSGLSFAPPGSAEAGSNLRAASVIWEWTAPGTREVVWPPRFAEGPVLALTPLS